MFLDEAGRDDERDVRVLLQGLFQWSSLAQAVHQHAEGDVADALQPEFMNSSVLVAASGAEMEPEICGEAYRRTCLPDLSAAWSASRSG